MRNTQFFAGVRFAERSWEVLNIPDQKAKDENRTISNITQLNYWVKYSSSKGPLKTAQFCKKTELFECCVKAEKGLLNWDCLDVTEAWKAESFDTRMGRYGM